MSDLKLPVDFEKKATANSSNYTGYPYRISASDLMSNFTYSALNADETWLEYKPSGRFLGRMLKLPKIPNSGNHVLGYMDGEVKWIEMEEC